MQSTVLQGSMRVWNWHLSWLCGAGWCVFLVVVSFGCAPSSTQRSSGSAETKPQVNRPQLPEKRQDDYVGAHVCVECHRDIAASYFQHPMGCASGATSSVNRVEQYGSETAFTSPDGRRYEAIEHDGQFWHHEQLFVDADELIYDQKVAIDLSIGSGRRGRSYGYLRGRQFFQSPMSWYSSKKCWDLSPGYQSGQHQRFDRLLTERCLYCHVGRLNPGPAPDTWDAKNPIAEYIICCERCHGPGASHVERYRHPDKFSGVDRIVNPGRLDAVRRDAVCHQCHLQANKTIPRFGRRSLDFRPGDRLADIWVVFQGAHADRKAVTQSDQIRSSICYQASNGRLGCISCHNPHSIPAGNPAAEFGRACLKCHGPGQTECATPVASRDEQSCIGCHMPRFSTTDIPHTALTDHRILRRPSAASHVPKSPTSLRVFDEGEPPLPDWEIRRAQALALRVDRTLVRSDFDLELGARILRSLKDQLADDPELWMMLAWINSRQGKVNELEAIARRVLALAPERIDAHELLLGSLVDRKAWTEVIRECEELIARDPNNANYHATLADAAWRLGDTDRGMREAETSLAHNAMQHDLRRRLVEVYRRQGVSEAAAAHQRILDRWPVDTR